MKILQIKNLNGSKVDFPLFFKFEMMKYDFLMPYAVVLYRPIVYLMFCFCSKSESFHRNRSKSVLMLVCDVFGGLMSPQGNIFGDKGHTVPYISHMLLKCRFQYLFKNIF